MFPREILSDILNSWIVDRLPFHANEESVIHLIKDTAPAEDITTSYLWSTWSAHVCDFKGYALVAGPSGGALSEWLALVAGAQRVTTNTLTAEFEYDAAGAGVAGPQTARYVVWKVTDGNEEEHVLRVWRLPVDKTFTNTGDRLRVNLTLFDVNIEHV